MDRFDVLGDERKYRPKRAYLSVGHKLRFANMARDRSSYFLGSALWERTRYGQHHRGHLTRPRVVAFARSQCRRKRSLVCASSILADSRSRVVSVWRCLAFRKKSSQALHSLNAYSEEDPTKAFHFLPNVKCGGARRMNARIQQSALIASLSHVLLGFEWFQNECPLTRRWSATTESGYREYTPKDTICFQVPV